MNYNNRWLDHEPADPEQKLARILEADTENGEFRYMVWSRQLRATPARVNILKVLSAASKPLSIDDILKELKKSRTKSDYVTVYRTVEKFAGSGLIDRIDLGGGKSLYEMSLGRKHHHHAVCTSCGAIEDVLTCEPRELNESARRGLKKFRHIRSHSLEFFGLCRKCEKRQS